ncbi:MAG: 2-oxo acid dehydrogenase subunit E2 [Pseudarcicella sp.]|nr:2-oxo acid dehydrogenase subunit E2 [Pseudarcicella sp.]MBP6409806.1 2-oxo acid dehydrogenase subunit E2 [Pseudarcicella sp.]
MALIEIIMPQMGESIIEAKVLNWLKQPGEYIEADEFILEVATDKIDTEVPSSHSGILHKILIKEGEMAQIGKAICLIENNETSREETISTDNTFEINEIETLTGINLDPTQFVEKSNIQNQFYSPLVINICKAEGITMDELAQIKGTGSGERITKYDILAFIEQRKTTVFNTKTSLPNNNIEIIEMDRMREMIAERMLHSKKTAPHVTSFVETDMTVMVNWRNNIKDNFKAKHNENITFTPLFVEAVSKAIKDYPMINSSLDGNKILLKSAINIGIAVALPNGNLIVPVIHHADKYNLVDLTKKINEIVNKARTNKLKPTDLEGGTFTISNIGTFGNIMGTPIILQPQVGILAFGAIQKKPSVIETPEGDLIGIRQKMFISHSYDHRIIDGSLGGQFLKRVSDYLENFDNKQLL